MKQSPLTVATHRLGISLFTLRQWCEKAGIDLEQQRSLADPRQKWLSEDQLRQLAADHGRLLDQEKPDSEPIPVHAYQLLVEQVARLVQQAEEMGTAQSDILTSIIQLQEQAEATVRQLAALEQTVSFQAEQSHQVQTVLQEEQQQIRAQLRKIDTHQEESAGRLGALLTAYEEHRQVLGRQAEQVSQLRDRTQHVEQEAARTAERIEAIATTSEQHGQQLSQLAARIDKQGSRHAQLASRVDALETLAQHIQKDMQAQVQEQVQQAERRLLAQFQNALTTLRASMQEEVERRVQGIEEEQARDLAALTAEQKRLDTQVQNAATRAEAATSTALGGQRRLDRVEQRLTAFQTQLEAEQAASTTLAESVNRLLSQAATEPEQMPGRQRTGRKKSDS